MPRVLIADDNSNIQKMVSLALKDAGIEVIGVNNGEAAVRKMPEILPDLVLADIFMPVRSGYEVCEYVKNDPRFAQVPVVLLAGAFDPFDELEAKRVRADGVLKKPFVPPDPLLSMVTSLLTKAASERLVPVSVAASHGKAAQPEHTAVREAPVEEFMDEPPAEFKMPMDGMTFADEKTLAFGSLLESPTAPAEADLESPVTSNPGLVDTSLWHHAQANETLALEELSGGHAWDELVLESTDVGHLQPAEMDRAQETAATEYQPEELEQLTEENPASTNDPIEVAGLPPAAETPFLVEQPAPTDLKHTVADEAETNAAEALFSWRSLPIEETSSTAEHELIGSDFSAVADAPAPATEQYPAVEPAATRDAEPTTATELNQASSSEIAELGELPGLPHLVETVSRYVEAESEPATIAAAQTAFASVSPEPSGSSPDEPQALDEAQALNASLDVPLLAASHGVASEPVDQELFEAVVARVINRMQPQMIEIVTREILRPVVEALVRRELEKK